MRKVCIVSIYSIIHFIVDMACALLINDLLMDVIQKKNVLMISLILYNFFAFALQLPIGIIADKVNKNIMVSLIGCVGIIFAYVINSFVIVSCIVAGIGNALFHIGGGIDILNISERKATLPGIYVATGALGLYIGSNLESIGVNKYYAMISLLLIAIVALIWLYRQKYTEDNEEPTYDNLSNKKQLIIICLLLTICIRSYVGLILKFEWKSDFIVGLICVIAVVLGKMIGGIVGDRLGWKKTTIVSLFISAILFMFAFNNVLCGVVAMILFNMTMPITLTAISNIFYKNKGMAFGFTTLALFIGGIPELLGYGGIMFSPIGLFGLNIVSAIILYVGLIVYQSLEDKDDL